QTSKGELKLSPGEIEKAQCDCMISQPGTRNTSSIPPKIRREVMARDRHQCQRPGCGNTRFLEVHHIIPRSRGGTNEITNLACVCSSCHKFLHDNDFSQGQILEQFAKGRG
ncbi:MAG: HNH endonuclease, partial [Gemmatimonadales bacterium]|nr:HNH endonuclease [Gemmatimonadales bacterium]